MDSQILKLASINVRGLNMEKINNLKKLISDYDIISLQELHNVKQKLITKLEDKLDVLFLIQNNYSISAAGVGFIIKNKDLQKNYKLLPTPNNLKGRLIHIQINQTNLFNIYAPALKSLEQQFYENLENYILDFAHEEILLMGDFNACDKDIDRSKNKIYNNEVSLLEKISQSCNIIDVYRYLNPNTIKYTYSFNNIDTTRSSRLDRFYINSSNKNNIIGCEITDYKIADHNVITLEYKMYNRTKWGRSYWKLNNSILRFPELILEINEIFQNFSDVSIKTWDETKEKISNICKKYSRLQSTNIKIIKEECNRILENPNTSETQQQETQKILDNITSYTNNGNKLRAGFHQDIFSLGKKIYRREEFKKGSNKILTHLKINNTLYTDKNDIINLTKKYYQDLYQSKNIDPQTMFNYLSKINIPKISKDSNEICEAEISIPEIIKAIEDLSKDKAPGIDGLTAEFYKTFKIQLAPILQNLYKCIYHNNIMTHTMRTGVITLLHKKGDTTDLKNWRPISLLNIDYKILSHILANRLKLTLSEIILPNQSCGEKGRNILDNILSIKSILEYVENNQRGWGGGGGGVLLSCLTKKRLLIRLRQSSFSKF
jgi:exonuclease III